MWVILLFIYFQTALLGFIVAFTRLPSLGTWQDHLKYILAGLFWPIYFVMWVFGYRLAKKYYLACPALDEWREKYKINENNNTRQD